MEERVRLAYKVADKMAFEYSGGDTKVPKEEQLVLDKWLAEGLITYVDTKKGHMSRLFYFPVLENEAWNGLSGALWLKTMHHVMLKNGFTSGLSQNSVNEYISRKYKYNIDHKVETAKYVGDKQVNEELAILDKIIKEEKEDGK